MQPFALNHMTVANSDFQGLLKCAAALGCVGVEVRNDLDQPLFDGASAQDAKAMAAKAGVQILAVAEVKQFNNWSDAKRDEAVQLMEIAQAADARAISLIPRNDGRGLGNGERQANLRLALRELIPLLESFDLIGLVEPLGFEISSLRLKGEAVDAIEAVGGHDRFQITHDTFHHHLAHEDQLFADHTGIVHISGVVDPALATAEMADADRVLVDGSDRLGNVRQIAALAGAGYSGPISFEAFATVVHNYQDPGAHLARSMEFIRSQLAAEAA